MPLISRLADGDPVDIAELATATGRSVDDVRDALAAVPDTEYGGSGRIIGQGLTLRATPHRFEINGEQLYTWCALDTLILPACSVKAPGSNPPTAPRAPRSGWTSARPV